MPRKENKFGAYKDKESGLWIIKVGNMTAVVGDDWYKDFVKEIKEWAGKQN